MQRRSLPALGPRYWTAISIASVFGANLGDFVSHDLRMGHLRGLAPLAVLLACILFGESRSRPGHEAWYWVAIVIVRTAATNLADLATHDLKLGSAVVVAGLGLALIAVLMIGRTAWSDRATSLEGAGDLPATTLRYWAAMLLAGTLGTALGDAVADLGGLGVGRASVLLCGVVALLLALSARSDIPGVAAYWVTIVAVRTAGTTMGDLVAHAAGLPTSTAVTGGLLVAVLLLWRPAPARLTPI